MPLKLVRRKGSPHWYVRGTVRGTHVFETTSTDDREAADAIRIKRESRLLDDSIFGPGSTVTFADAVVSYLEAGGEARFIGTWDHATKRGTLLLGHFGFTALGKIGQAEADEAARKLHPTTGPATRKRHVYAPLSAILRHAERKGWVRAPKIAAPAVASAEPKWATPEWVTALLPHCAPRLRRLVMTLVYTGARLSEALGLGWESDVNLQQRTILFRRTKNGKMRTAHIPDPLLIELASVAEAERSGALFLWSDKCHVYGPLRTACRKAGIAYLSPHQLGRHTFATWLRIYAKRDLRGLMHDGGWDSIASVARYAHVTPGESVAAVDALPSVQSACNANVKPIKDRRMRRKSA